MITNENVEYRVVLHVGGDAKDRAELLNEVADVIQDQLAKAYPATVHLKSITALV